LWRGAMTAHSVIAYRSDHRQQEFSFDDDRWPNYVPLRLPHTLCVTERLPRGAAGVLLNRSHQFHDLIVVIDPQEKRVFDAIDGRRSIAEVLGHAGADGHNARAVFETLWHYDQVVFDTSKA